MLSFFIAYKISLFGYFRLFLLFVIRYSSLFVIRHFIYKFERCIGSGAANILYRELSGEYPVSGAARRISCIGSGAFLMTNWMWGMRPQLWFSRGKKLCRQIKQFTLVIKVEASTLTRWFGLIRAIQTESSLLLSKLTRWFGIIRVLFRLNRNESSRIIPNHPESSRSWCTFIYL